MSNTKSSSTTATLVVAGSALGIAAATSAYRLANKSEKQESSSSFLNPAFQYLLQYWRSATGAAEKDVVQLLNCKTLVQGRVSDDGDTAEITKTSSFSEEEEESITSRSDSSNVAERVLVEEEDDDIPRSIEATPTAMEDTSQSQTPALLATSFMAILLLVASFVNEFGTESIMTALVGIQAMIMAFLAQIQASLSSS